MIAAVLESAVDGMRFCSAWMQSPLPVMRPDTDRNVCRCGCDVQSSKKKIKNVAIAVSTQQSERGSERVDLSRVCLPPFRHAAKSPFQNASKTNPVPNRGMVMRGGIPWRTLILFWVWLVRWSWWGGG